MTAPRQKRAMLIVYLAAGLLIVLLLAHLLGCEGAARPGVGSIYGYAYKGDGVTVPETELISLCSSTHWVGYVPAVDYLVYIDDTSGVPDATVSTTGYWAVRKVRAGAYTIHIYPPPGPPGPGLSFSAEVLAGQWQCQPTHEQGGG